MALAGALGAGPLVFGSPKNRKVGGRPRAEVDAIAVGSGTTGRICRTRTACDAAFLNSL